MMVGVLAKAAGELADHCAVEESYPITVLIGGAASRTTVGRCRSFLKNPCAEGVCDVLMPAETP
jgi:hypothetical protein